MRIKTYYSGTVEAALALAGRELGDDALLLSARPAPTGLGHLGAYEVVAGCAAPETESCAPAEPSDLVDFLRSMDCCPATIERVLGDAEGDDLDDNQLKAILGKPLRLPSALNVTAPVTMLVGPTGGGKTTTLCKLAIREQAHAPVLIVDADSRKAGANVSLRRIAGIAGIDYEFAARPDDVSGILKSCGNRRVFIDTPGFSPSCAPEAVEWASVLAKSHAGLETHLVLSAVTRTADLLLTGRRYSMFVPQRLIFTRLDECSCFGGIVSVAAATGLPLSWFTTGQQIPDDIEPAGLQRIFEPMNTPGAALLAAAAGASR